MASRKDSSPLDELLELAAVLPWWLDLGLAAGSLFALRAVEHSHRPVAVTTAGDVGQTLTRTLIYGFAVAGKWVLPVVFVLGAVLSAKNRHRRQRILSNASGNDAASFVARMAWTDFEVLIGEAFRRKGYQVVETGGGGADGGIDLVLSKGRETWLVQCKHWKATKVGVSVVRELFGVMASQGATGAYVVTSGSFTADAVAFVEGRNIELIDGPKLLALTSGIDPQTSIPSSPRIETVTAPKCPSCGVLLTRRTARRGANAGQAFWGCPNFPKCRHTRPI